MESFLSLENALVSLLPSVLALGITETENRASKMLTDWTQYKKLKGMDPDGVTGGAAWCQVITNTIWTLLHSSLHFTLLITILFGVGLI